MTVRLRPHHLLCVLTYVGKGYSPAFVANYDRVAERIGRGEDITIVSGPDDICAPLMGEPDPHCLRESVVARDARAAQDLSELLGVEIAEGARLAMTSDVLTSLRQAFAERQTRSACDGCNWSELCDEIAGDGFQGTRF